MSVVNIIAGMMSGGNQGVEVPPPPIDPQPSIETVWNDDGGSLPYNGFPWPDTLSNGAIITTWKRAANHADKGPIMLSRSNDGGTTKSTRQLTVDGSPVQCASLGFKRIGSRVFVCYQDSNSPVPADDYKEVSFAWCDEDDLINHFSTATFTSAGTLNLPSPPADHYWTAAPFGKMLQLPSGKILQPFYRLLVDISVPETPVVVQSIAEFIESTNNGVSWAFGDIICDHAGTDVFDAITSEIYVVITELGVSDETTKMVAIIRNESHGVFTHTKSADGGATWTRDYTEDAGVGGPFSRALFYPLDGSIAKIPVHLVVHEGTAYIFAGLRRAGNFTISYITCTPAQLYSNIKSNYSGETVLAELNADTLGAAIDCGYCEWFIDYFNTLVLQWYDISTLYVSGDRRCWIYQKPMLPL